MKHNHMQKDRTRWSLSCEIWLKKVAFLNQRWTGRGCFLKKKISFSICAAQVHAENQRQGGSWAGCTYQLLRKAWRVIAGTGVRPRGLLYGLVDGNVFHHCQAAANIFKHGDPFCSLAYNWTSVNIRMLDSMLFYNQGQDVARYSS